VALLIETSNAYARGLLQGVVHYIREHRPWSFHLMEQGRGDDPPEWLEGWKGDGIIARIETPRIAAAVVRAGGSVARSMLVGDTDTDRRTARAAGVPVALVTFGPEGRDIARLDPDALLDHFDHLPELAERLVR